jgi:hypothetical protein
MRPRTRVSDVGSLAMQLAEALLQLDPRKADPVLALDLTIGLATSDQLSAWSELARDHGAYVPDFDHKGLRDGTCDKYRLAAQVSLLPLIESLQSYDELR